MSSPTSSLRVIPGAGEPRAAPRRRSGGRHPGGPEDGSSGATLLSASRRVGFLQTPASTLVMMLRSSIRAVRSLQPPPHRCRQLQSRRSCRNTVCRLPYARNRKRNASVPSACTSLSSVPVGCGAIRDRLPGCGYGARASGPAFCCPGSRAFTRRSLGNRVLDRSSRAYLVADRAVPATSPGSGVELLESRRFGV